MVLSEDILRWGLNQPMHLIELLQCPTQILLEHIFRTPIVIFTSDNKVTIKQNVEIPALLIEVLLYSIFHLEPLTFSFNC